MDKIRCVNCRGSKQVAKLGGMIGDCNLCSGTGLIDSADRMKSPVNEVSAPIQDIIKQVANVAPKAIRIEKNKATSDDNAIVLDEPQIKINPKKALYKKKTA